MAVQNLQSRFNVSPPWLDAMQECDMPYFICALEGTAALWAVQLYTVCALVCTNHIKLPLLYLHMVRVKMSTLSPQKKQCP